MTTDPLQSAPKGQATPRRLDLPRETRVVRASDFERAWKQGSRARGDVLLVVAAANELPLARIGLSVGKKFWKRAVDRNRVRRIFREAFRLTRHDLPPGHDYILVPAARVQPTLVGACRELAHLGPKAVARLRAKAAEGVTPP
ncbi:MAG TPA: ribonuclease P protein component [Planctomycetota bacterium]|nr:ribonuclease P protein component [Planctomycetota bacterium]